MSGPDAPEPVRCYCGAHEMRPMVENIVVGGRRHMRDTCSQWCSCGEHALTPTTETLESRGGTIHTRDRCTPGGADDE